MAQFHQRQIIGKWQDGSALDVRTLIRPFPIDHNEYGQRVQFEHEAVFHFGGWPLMELRYVPAPKWPAGDTSTV